MTSVSGLEAMQERCNGGHRDGHQAEIVERSFAHNLDRGGMRRTWLRGRENVHKRYLVHVAGHNLGILMRLLIGAGTPKAAADRASAWLFFAHTEEAAVLILLAASREGIAVLMLVIVLDQTGTSATRC